ncbi:type II toxin-antitoxin system HipA family toxin [Duganella callida]|uniref:Type II toxin-antitoxin system HipA family toxin n=1 Tax=Duganella callida TaxID=2561932 RepID=A0A4Y9SEY4_9BURK|nr:HipA domain-containing protein [Duganella callida]TFW19655.1 type II toxin-antitoxin system HipA family toxin [Duganella callida]
MKLLHVIYNGWNENWQLGTLADNGHDILFEYTPEALRRGLELSPRHLPLRALAFGGFPDHQHRLPGLIADTLPDSYRTPAGVSPLDHLALIGEHGRGALSYAAPGAKPPPPAEQYLQVLLGLDASWLIKLPAPGEHKEVCAIEHVYAQLARACGLDMPETRHYDLERRLSAFAVRRYDRRFDNGSGMRLPVHTLAGLLHADFHLPATDYSIFLRATRLITRDERQVEAAFQRCVFNVLFNNRADHARSFAYRMARNGDWQLAPCYDLGFHAGEHQMPVMGERLAPALTDLLRLAADAALPERRARDMIAAMTAQAGLFAKLARTAPIRAVTVRAIARSVSANRQRLLGRA